MLPAGPAQTRVGRAGLDGRGPGVLAFASRAAGCRAVSPRLSRAARRALSAAAVGDAAVPTCATEDVWGGEMPGSSLEDTGGARSGAGGPAGSATAEARSSILSVVWILAQDSPWLDPSVVPEGFGV